MSPIGYVIATRNRASGHLAIDWDGDIHYRREHAIDQLIEARNAGEEAELLRLELEDTDDA